MPAYIAQTGIPITATKVVRVKTAIFKVIRGGFFNI
jgi:hypothetical protein